METTHSESLNVLGCQVDIPETRSREQRNSHVARLVEVIGVKLEERHADLVVLPELATIEYSRNSFHQLDDLAEELDGESVCRMRTLAMNHNTTVVFGMPRKSGGDFLISQVAINPDGEVAGCYDKLHICQYGASMEKEFFERGDGLTAFEVKGMRFAPIICYDIRIPELSRVLVTEHSVDCILHCGAYFRDESFATWHAFAATRALENQVFILSLNRAGKDYGHSLYCLPWMDEQCPAVEFNEHDEDFRYFNLDPALINQARRDYTFLTDRLENYSALELG